MSGASTIVQVLMLLWASVLFISTVGSFVNVFSPNWHRKWRHARYVKKLLKSVEAGELLRYDSYELMIEWYHPLGDKYRKYIAGLPVWRKHQIIDSMLETASKKTGSSELVKNVMSFHEVEIETLATIVLAGTEHASWYEVRDAIPNAIILYRLANPTEAL